MNKRQAGSLRFSYKLGKPWGTWSGLSFTRVALATYGKEAVDRQDSNNHEHLDRGSSWTQEGAGGE